MRQLRKTNMEYEERNAALQKHVESMRGAVERLDGDVRQERGRNGLLQQHLETLRQALTSSFSSVALPGETETHTHAHTDTHQLYCIHVCLFCIGPGCSLQSPSHTLQYLSSRSYVITSGKQRISFLFITITPHFNGYLKPQWPRLKTSASCHLLRTNFL
jgi:hypothetical protein